MKVIAKIPFVIAGAFALSAYAASPIEVNLKDAKGGDVGTATLTEVSDGVKIKVNAKGLTPGEHAIHFHEKASCVGPKFDSAGGHFAPLNKKHGEVPGGPHAGDMPNLKVSADGTVTTEFTNTKVKLGKGDNSLLRAGGTALVIHAKADDYKSQPSGDAGDRQACGEVKDLITK